ncbi:fungal-specific transcription factor domain-containing protein [Lipomyces oligophaga]|uniref:fungal-specific transcription factor domain-containing protein n=1 Tax=Lipomyces oligophaga TaxID=45792 RepID=UPI0034CD6790
MFVFPANDEGYRKRKRAHKACEQCKRRRKRCEAPFRNHERCAPCMKENIPCSIVDNGKSAPRSVAKQIVSSVADIATSSTAAARVNLAVAAVPAVTAAASMNSVLNSAVQTTSPQTKLSDAAFSSATLSSSTSTAFDNAMSIPPNHTTTSLFSGHSVTARPLSSTSRSVASGQGAGRRSTDALNDDIGSTRFIGDLDPASVLLTLRNIDKDRIGVWVKGAAVHHPVNQFLLSYLDSIRAFDLPSRQDRDGIISCYFEYVHPLLPLLDKSSFLQLHQRDECPTLLLHAVLLAACRHPKARRFIRSRSPRHFATITATKIRALIYADIERDKLTIVRVLALLSLHSEGSEGLEKSCSNLEQAFHYAHFLGLHHERSSYPEMAPMRRIWWTLWCLDRISACVCARPVISRLDDVGVTGLRAGHEPPEDEWLTRLYDVCNILDRVIAMYRPLGSTLPSEVDFELSYGNTESSPLAAFLHLLRHAACILAHKRAPESPERNVAILLHSTNEIIRIVRSNPLLPPFPAVPYAVSLTLTVYLRLYPSPEAIQGWHKSCEVLDDLAPTWWVAEAMGSMARSVFRKLEEDLANRQSGSGSHSSSSSSSSRNTSSSPTGHPARSLQKTQSAQPNVLMSTLANDIPSAFSLTSPSSVLSVPAFTPPPLIHVPSEIIPTADSPASGVASQPNLETQFLEMFSDLPNPTSFLDQAFLLDDFSNMTDLLSRDSFLFDNSATASTSAVVANQQGSNVADELSNPITSRSFSGM